MSWVTKTAGWLAIIYGVLGGVLGLIDPADAGILVTNGMGYLGVDRKFKRAGWNGQGGQS
jgi:hypothetical protein